MRKALQSKLYDFINSRTGILIFVIGGFACTLGVISCLHAVIHSFGPGIVQAFSNEDPKTSSFPSPCHLVEGTCAARFSDNIVGRSFEKELCAPVIDVVYTWVNGSDPRLQAELKDYKERLGITPLEDMKGNVSADDSKGNSNRYRDNQELRYSLRSLWRFAPWIRRIYIVTNYQVPYWLNIDHPKIEVVPHKAIFVNASHLPVFSSPAIESHLHRIPGLADKFIYFNDDVMLGNEVWPSDFYTLVKGQKVYLSWDIPQCAPGCPEAWLADKYCDAACNTSMCNWDEGDCRLVNGSRYTSWQFSNQANPSAFVHSNTPRAPQQPERPASGGSASDKQQKCHRFCPDSWIGDKVCDNSCNRVECAFDAGDCGAEDIQRNILGLTLENNNGLTRIPPTASAFYVNLTNMFDLVLDASHDNQDFVRTAIITQELHILVFLLHEKPERATWEEAIEVFLEGEYGGSVRNVTFLIARAQTDSRPDGSAGGANNSTGGEGAGQPEPAGVVDAVGSRGAEEEPGDEMNVTSTAASRNLLWVPRRIARKFSYFGEGGAGGGNGEDMEAYIPTADLFTVAAQIQSVPDGVGGTVPKQRWSEEDKALAERIGAAKRKELALHLLDEAREYETAEVERLVDEGKRKSGVVLPSEMQRRVTAKVKEWLEEEMLHPFQGANGRRLLEDTFGNSLRYVNSLYRARYGSEQRKAPAHMPHMIDKNIMAELQATFPDEFGATSSHRFRDSGDMQFSFSYFYYLMNEKPAFDLDKLFAEKLDLNKDGKLDLLEVRHLALLLMPGKPTVHGMRARMSQLLDDLEAPQTSGLEEQSSLSDAPASSSDSEESGLPPSDAQPSENERAKEGERSVVQMSNRVKAANITVGTIRSSEKVMEELRKLNRKKTKYKHELVNLNEVEFFMVPDDYQQVQERLDHITVKSPKFICLNDDMNKTHDPPKRTLQALHDFYETYYPDPTPFELPVNESNPYLYYDELIAYKQEQHRLRMTGTNT
mmetsp:Transcript_10120/g.24916  ORF Transcript_10120/g.24916 Transcript_10120/m.24916 type:complete len:995 (-) Transcript_10120:135-3119(-)